MTTARIISDEEKHGCAMRELRFRRLVYKGRVAKGRMHAAEAAREIEVMAAIAKDYRFLIAFASSTVRSELPL